MHELRQKSHIKTILYIRRPITLIQGDPSRESILHYAYPRILNTCRYAIYISTWMQITTGIAMTISVRRPRRPLARWSNLRLLCPITQASISHYPRFRRPTTTILLLSLSLYLSLLLSLSPFSLSLSQLQYTPTPDACPVDQVPLNNVFQFNPLCPVHPWRKNVSEFFLKFYLNLSAFWSFFFRETAE